MSRFWKFVRVTVASAVVCGMALPVLPSLAQEKKDDKPAAEEKKEEEKPDPYVVPADANVEELVAFIKELKSFRPTTREEYINHSRKAPLALKTAADKIKELDKDPKSAANRLATGTILLQEVRGITQATPEAKAEFFTKAQEYINASDKTAEDLQLAMQVGMGLEFGGARDLAGKAYNEFGAAFAKSEDAQVAKQAEMLVGAGRRMNLMGNPVELTGTTMDGKEFNVANLKGKVVLIDFWATWCGPCRAEYPNLKKNYDAYHDKGFEVVGVSLDQDREALEKYVKDEEVPWTTLHEKELGGRHPAATYYGIFGIPTVLLVNKEGKVISLNARGAELGKLLEKELGPAEEKKEETKAEAEK